MNAKSRMLETIRMTISKFSIGLYFMGFIMPQVPNTRSILKIFEPMMLPIANSDFPFETA